MRSEKPIQKMGKGSGQKAENPADEYKEKLKEVFPFCVGLALGFLSYFLMEKAFFGG